MGGLWLQHVVSGSFALLQSIFNALLAFGTGIEET